VGTPFLRGDAVKVPLLGVRDGARYCTKPSMTQIGDLVGTTRPRRRPAFEFLAERPDPAETFHRAMSSFSVLGDATRRGESRVGHGLAGLTRSKGRTRVVAQHSHTRRCVPGTLSTV
jgi:hypothetical protein